VWTIFSIIGVQIKADLGLNETQFGLLVATPILTGSLTRIVLGVWTEQYGGRLVFPRPDAADGGGGVALTFATTYPMFLSRRSASGSPAARSSSASPMSRAGTPRRSRARRSASSGRQRRRGGDQVYRALRHGRLWLAGGGAGLGRGARGDGGGVLRHEQGRPGACPAPRRGERRPPSMASQLAPLKNLQVWRFSLYYFFTFGAFVALALWLPRYLIWVYDVDIRSPACWRPAFSLPAAPFAPMAECSPTASARAR
jgi:MFS transporter, NNP family, nitrate/nitrite transporter